MYRGPSLARMLETVSLRQYGAVVVDQDALFQFVRLGEAKRTDARVWKTGDAYGGRLRWRAHEVGQAYDALLRGRLGILTETAADEIESSVQQMRLDADRLEASRPDVASYGRDVAKKTEAFIQAIYDKKLVQSTEDMKFVGLRTHDSENVSLALRLAQNSPTAMLTEKPDHWQILAEHAWDGVYPVGVISESRDYQLAGPKAFVKLRERMPVTALRGFRPLPSP